MTKEPLVVCGELVLCCQEGGYCSDSLVVDRKGLDELVRDHFGIDGYDPDPYASVGRVRIAIEPLSGTSDLEMNEEELRDHINQRLQVAEAALANAVDYQEFKPCEVLTQRLRNASALLKRGDIDGAWSLLETSE